jgi:hypothetical protein
MRNDAAGHINNRVAPQKEIQINATWLLRATPYPAQAVFRRKESVQGLLGTNRAGHLGNRVEVVWLRRSFRYGLPKRRHPQHVQAWVRGQ